MRRKYTVEDDRLIGQSCPACQVSFNKGDQVTNVTIGPGDDPEAMEACRSGRPYDAVCVIAHWSCVTGEGHVPTKEEPAALAT